MSDYVIEKSIPMPAVKGGASTPFSKAIKSLEVGDSFVVEKKRGTGCLAKHYGRKFATRTVDGVTRIWRTE